MKRVTWLVIGGLGLALAAAQALAGDPAAPAGPRCPLRARILEKFDKDGDGKLSDEERAAAREAFRARLAAHKEEILKRFDKDGDGKLSDEERAATRESLRNRLAAHWDQILKRFDKDGDGKLSDEERAAAREAFRQPRHGSGPAAPEAGRGAAGTE